MSTVVPTRPAGVWSTRLRRDHPLGTMVIRRVTAGVLTLLVVSVVLFGATRVLPGNAALAILGHNATPARLHALEARLHLDRPLPAQYWAWLSGLLGGHLGRSLVNGEPVWQLVEPRLVNSALLAALAGAIGAVIGILGGVLAALRKDGWFDHLSAVAALALTSLPEFVVGIGLTIAFSTLWLHLFPAVSQLTGTYAWEQPSALVLPVATLVVVIVPYIMRMTRGVMIEVLESDYVEMAKLKGVSATRLVFAYALPNAIAPIGQVIGLTYLYLAGGVVIVEAVFNYPGVGLGLVDAVNNRDLPVLQFIVMALAAFYVMMNIATDVLALIATPRRRIPR